MLKKTVFYSPYPGGVDLVARRFLFAHALYVQTQVELSYSSNSLVKSGVMPPKKKKRLSKSQKKELFKKLSSKGNEVRGSGVGGRRDFELPALWQTQHVGTSDGKVREEYLSPGKTLYKTQKSVVDTFATRDRKGCLQSYRDSTTDDDEAKDPDYSDGESAAKKVLQFESKPMSGIEMEERMFISQTPQIMDFVDQVNETSQCTTPGCKGKKKF